MGFFGLILLAKGVLKLTPDIIAKYSQTYWDYNKLQLENIVSQKADFVCGVILIAFAFLIQIINLIFVRDSLKVSLFSGIAIGTCSIFLILFIMFLNVHLGKKYRIDSQKFLARERLVDCLRNKKISNSEYQSLLGDAERLCNIKKNSNEPPADFLRSYSAYLELDIPDTIDLSELQK